VILGQCTPTTRSKLESNSNFSTLENNDDVVGLLEELKKMAFMTGGEKDPFWMLQEVLKCFMAINQGPMESVDNYSKRFEAIVKVVEAQWGDFVPLKLAGSGATAANKKEARGKFLSRLMLSGVDKKCYLKLIEDLNNNYLAGKDNYPLDLDSTVTLLSHYQDHQSGSGQQKMDDDGMEGIGTSFVQHKDKGRQRSRVVCFCCGKHGHIEKDCPMQQSNTQIDQMDDVMMTSWLD
jgi:hypothetical protein